MANVSDLPVSLRGVGHYIKIANEYASRDVVIYYWTLYYAVQHGMTLDKTSPPAIQFLTSLLSSLEKIKKDNHGNDALTQDIVAQSYIENHALKLFNYADKMDKEGNFGKNVVKSFYTSGHLFDILSTFGELDENLQSARKYAKWKATYIHNCLKNGETPIPGPPKSENPDEDTFSFDQNALTNSFTQHQQPTNNFQQPYGFSQNQQPYPQQNAFTTPQPPPRAYPEHTSALPQTISHSTPNLPSSNFPHQEPTISASTSLTIDEFTEARKFVKYALSALDYEDSKTAIENMKKAMQILQKN